MKEHVTSIVQLASQSLYALKLLKSKGLDPSALRDVFNATVISRLTYAAPSWWGYSTKSERNVLQSVINRAVKWGFCTKGDYEIEQLCSTIEDKLFSNVLDNIDHVLHQFLPPEKTCPYSLRPRAHNRTLPSKEDKLFSLHFSNRMLYDFLV